MSKVTRTVCDEYADQLRKDDALKYEGKWSNVLKELPSQPTQQVMMILYHTRKKRIREEPFFSLFAWKPWDTEDDCEGWDKRGFWVPFGWEAIYWCPIPNIPKHLNTMRIKEQENDPLD